MPLLILNISFCLKYSLLYEQNSVCVNPSLLPQGFQGNLGVLEFGELQIVPGHQMILSWGRRYLQVQCVQPLHDHSLTVFCACAAKSSQSE